MLVKLKEIQKQFDLMKFKLLWVQAIGSILFVTVLPENNKGLLCNVRLSTFGKLLYSSNSLKLVSYLSAWLGDSHLLMQDLLQSLLAPCQ